MLSHRTTASTDVGATRLLDPADDPEVRQRVDDAVEMARARARRGSRAIRPPRIASSLLRESQHAGSGSGTPAARLLLSCLQHPSVWLALGASTLELGRGALAGDVLAIRAIFFFFFFSFFFFFFFFLFLFSSVLLLRRGVRCLRARLRGAIFLARARRCSCGSPPLGVPVCARRVRVGGTAVSWTGLLLTAWAMLLRYLRRLSSLPFSSVRTSMSMWPTSAVSMTMSTFLRRTKAIVAISLEIYFPSGSGGSVSFTCPTSPGEHAAFHRRACIPAAPSTPTDAGVPTWAPRYYTHIIFSASLPSVPAASLSPTTSALTHLPPSTSPYLTFTSTSSPSPPTLSSTLLYNHPPTYHLPPTPPHHHPTPVSLDAGQHRVPRRDDTGSCAPQSSTDQRPRRGAFSPPSPTTTLESRFWKP